MTNIIRMLERPGVVYKYASNREESGKLWRRAVDTAYYTEDESGNKTVVVVESEYKVKSYSLDEDLIPAGSSFIFKSDDVFYSVGPFDVADYKEFFSGVPLPVDMMEELFSEEFYYKVEAPGGEDSLVERLYIQKLDGSFYTKTGKGWEQGLDGDDTLNLVQISPSKAARIANALVNESPLSASQLGIASEVKE